MKKAVPTTSQLELIKNFTFKQVTSEGDKPISGKKLDRDVPDDLLKILDLLEQFYKLSKTSKFKYGKPVDQFDLNKVFDEIFLDFEPATGIYYNPTFELKPMGLSYLISFIMHVRHERNIEVTTYNSSSLINLLTRSLKYMKELLAENMEHIKGLSVVTISNETLNYDVERFEEEEELSGEGLSYLFDGSKVPFRYKDLSPHFTKYIVETISRQIRRMAKRGEIDAKTTTIEPDTKPLLRGGKVIRRSKGGQPITAKVQVSFLRAVLDDLLYEEGGEDIVRQIASLDKNEFDEFMRNKKYNRSLTTIFTQFVNVAIKENLNKLGYYDVVAGRFRGDSFLVAKSNVTQNFFKSLDIVYNPEIPDHSFGVMIDEKRGQLNKFLAKQIPVAVDHIELYVESDTLVVLPNFITYAENSRVLAKTLFVLDFKDERIYYSTSHYTSDRISVKNFKQIASSISMDIDDPLRDLITLLGQMTKPDEVSSRAFGGKEKVPEYKSLRLLREVINLMPKKNIVKIEGPAYNSLLGTITGGMLLGVYDESIGTILNSLTYISFDSIRTRRETRGRKNICMVQLAIKKYMDQPRYYLENRISNCIFSPADLSTGDTVGTVVASIARFLNEYPHDYTLGGRANIQGGLLYSFPFDDETSARVNDIKQKLTDAILEITSEDLDEVLFNDGRIELLTIEGED